MIRFTRSFALLCLAALAALSIGVPRAFAADVTPWKSVAVSVSTDPGEAVLIVSGTLPEGTPLPATVELAIPSGGVVQWAGEILGGDAAQDPEVQPVKSVRDGQDVYRFTLTKALTGQLEVSVSPPVTTAGDVNTVDFAIPAWADFPEAGVAVKIPASAALSVVPTGTAGLAPDTATTQYYQQEFTNVKKGDLIGAKFSYTLQAAGAAGAPTAAGTGSGLVIPILLVMVAAAIGVALVVGVRRKLALNAPEESPSPARQKRTQAAAQAATQSRAETSAFSDDDDADPLPVRTDTDTPSADADDSADDAPRAPRSNVALIGTLVVVGAIVLAGIFAASQGGKAQTTNSAITKTFSNQEACTTAQITLAFPQGTDTANAAEQMFTALATVPSITKATVRTDSPSISVGYCDSTTTEDAIRAALAPTGFLVAGSATAPSGTATGSAEATAVTN